MSSNRDELHAEKWLRAQGYTQIRELPLGCDPPDFEVTDGGSVYAVEVRRLDQILESSSGDPIPVETYDQSLYDNIKKIVDEHNASNESTNISCTCLLSLRSNRPPLKLNAKARKRLRKQIQKEISVASRTQEKISYLPLEEYGLFVALSFVHHCTGNCVGVRLKVGIRFSVGGGAEENLIRESILRSVREKTDKVVRKLRSCGQGYNRYEEWWLVLTDHLLYSGQLSNASREILVEHKEFWTKVFLIHPQDVNKYSEL